MRKRINVFSENVSSTIFPYFSWLYVVCYSQKCRGNVKNILKGEANLRSSFPYCLKRLCLCWQNEIDMYIFSRLSIFFPFPLLIKSEIHIVSDWVYQPETRVLFKVLQNSAEERNGRNALWSNSLKSIFRSNIPIIKLKRGIMVFPFLKHYAYFLKWELL